MTLTSFKQLALSETHAFFEKCAKKTLWHRELNLNL